MIIRKIHIENYLCYYDINTFELAEGLNIVLGENGEGKTKIFEAIEWLFNGSDRELDLLVSAKKLHEIQIGDSFTVGVSMIVEQYGEKGIITKSFLSKKENHNECSTSNFMLVGIEENSSGERIQVDGKILLNRLFPAEIRKYSMFKGEAELNIFKNEYALVNLINLFSDAKHYAKYAEKGLFLKGKAEKAVELSSKKDKKNEELYRNLEKQIAQLEKEKAKYSVYLNSTEEEIRKIEENLQDAERHVYNADLLEIINRRIKVIEEKISTLNATIDENYTTFLFDEKWILVNFEPFLKEFTDKVTYHSKKRREIQSEFDRMEGLKEGKLKAKAELLNNTYPLPIGVPSKTHMEEMLEEQLCKVCNREAKKGSEAYNFMFDRLKSYLESQIVKDSKMKVSNPLFKYDFTNRLLNLSISQEDNLKGIRLIRNKIKELFIFNSSRKTDVEELKDQLENERKERDEILGNSGVAEEKLTDVLKNYNAWQKDLKIQNQDQLNYSNKLIVIESDLRLNRENKENIDTKSANSFLIKTRNILRDIETIFNTTKEKKFEEFINRLQSKSNIFFKKINVDSFTGTIEFTKRRKSGRSIVEVDLKEDGRTFHRPNQSLETSKHIAILFAISDLAREIKQENFPLIFDAPISSFGETKSGQFLNLIFETKNQKILLIKDFIVTDKITNTLSIKKEFKNIRRDKAFWVKLERPFDPNNLKTINTQVITL